MFGALIVAAGKGSRMKNDIPKQFLTLKGKYVILHTLEKFIGLGDFFKKIVVVIPPGSEKYCREVIFSSVKESSSLFLVEGGNERQDSVLKGLLSFEDEEIVCIHDGVRPLVSPELIKRTALKVLDAGAVIPVIAINDTLKEINDQGQILKTIPRENYKMAQTPQCFRKKIIMDALLQAQKEGFYATDDAALLEKKGCAVLTIPGERDNIKLTTQDDFIMAEIIMERREKSCTEWA